MRRLLQNIAFWSFQVINTVTGFLMTFFPKAFHESLFSHPESAYAKLGFSATAVEMLHNVVRGHGAALLAVSVFLWIVRMKTRQAHLLIFLVCALAVYAHFLTLKQHLESAAVMNAVPNLISLYVTIGVTAVVGALNAAAYFLGRDRQV